MDLLSQAGAAEDVAAGLKVFLDELPSKGPDISLSISSLFAISSALRTLNDQLDSNRYARTADRIGPDLDLVLPSLDRTLEAVRYMFGQSRSSKYTGMTAYDIVYDELCLRFKYEEGPSLGTRLEMYKSFLQGLIDILTGRVPEGNMDRLRARVERLLNQQESEDTYLARLRASRARSRSRGRSRSGARRTSIPGVNYVPPFANYPPRRPSPPPYPDDVLDDTPDPRVPPAPEVPLTPSISNSSNGTFSTGFSSGANGRPAHWAKRILDDRHPATPFRVSGKPTQCFGRDEPLALDHLASDDFLEVLKLPFEAADVYVRLYWRPQNHRARILFSAKHPSGGAVHYCTPLTALTVIRSDSCLQLCRFDPEHGHLVLWGNLRFRDFERLVLFYSTFIAMKGQDWEKARNGLEDPFPMRGEVEEFGGEISDEHLLHALRIFRDPASGGVRLEATALRGPMKKTPIWTAFVTQYVGSQTWVRRADHRTIQLRTLKPYIFCEKYAPPKGRNGSYELRFTSRNDAENFIEIFHSLRAS